jgi:hypothetical protein
MDELETDFRKISKLSSTVSCYNDFSENPLSYFNDYKQKADVSNDEELKRLFKELSTSNFEKLGINLSNILEFVEKNDISKSLIDLSEKLKSCIKRIMYYKRRNISQNIWNDVLSLYLVLDKNKIDLRSEQSKKLFLDCSSDILLGYDKILNPENNNIEFLETIITNYYNAIKSNLKIENSDKIIYKFLEIMESETESFNKLKIDIISILNSWKDNGEIVAEVETIRSLLCNVNTESISQPSMNLLTKIIKDFECWSDLLSETDFFIKLKDIHSSNLLLKEITRGFINTISGFEDQDLVKQTITFLKLKLKENLNESENDGQSREIFEICQDLIVFLFESHSDANIDDLFESLEANFRNKVLNMKPEFIKIVIKKLLKSDDFEGKFLFKMLSLLKSGSELNKIDSEDQISLLNVILNLKNKNFDSLNDCLQIMKNNCRNFQHSNNASLEVINSLLGGVLNFKIGELIYFFYCTKTRFEYFC